MSPTLSASFPQSRVSGWKCATQNSTCAPFGVQAPCLGNIVMAGFRVVWRGPACHRIRSRCMPDACHLPCRASRHAVLQTDGRASQCREPTCNSRPFLFRRRTHGSERKVHESKAVEQRTDKERQETLPGIADCHSRSDQVRFRNCRFRICGDARSRSSSRA